MPNPNDYENKSDFIKACVPIVKKENPDKTMDEVLGQCYGMWDNKTKNAAESKDAFIARCIKDKPSSMSDDIKKKVCEEQWREVSSVDRLPPGGGDQGGQQDGRNARHSERVLLKLGACLKPLKLDNKNKDIHVTEFDRSTILVGDKVYNGIFFPVKELEKAFLSWDSQPINLDHSDNVEDEVGYVSEPRFENNRITVKPVLNSKTGKYSVAQGFIDNRIQANRVPEVSVGVFADKEYIIEEEMKNYPEGAIFKAANLEGDHLAIVTRGACNPQDGCGIGLSEQDETPIVQAFYTVNNSDIRIPFEDIDKLIIDILVKENIEKKIRLNKIKLENLKGRK